MIRFLRNSVAVFLLLAVQTATAQQRPQRVDARNTYERCLALVPMTGTGTHADPKRPMYAPNPLPLAGPAAQTAATSRAGILAYQCVPSEDGNLALCEL